MAHQNIPRNYLIHSVTCTIVNSSFFTKCICRLQSLSIDPVYDDFHVEFNVERFRYKLSVIKDAPKKCHERFANCARLSLLYPERCSPGSVCRSVLYLYGYSLPSHVVCCLPPVTVTGSPNTLCSQNKGLKWTSWFLYWGSQLFVVGFGFMEGSIKNPTNLGLLITSLCFLFIAPYVTCLFSEILLTGLLVPFTPLQTISPSAGCFTMCRTCHPSIQDVSFLHSWVSI
jgi:hypothetical protein